MKRYVLSTLMILSLFGVSSAQAFKIIGSDGSVRTGSSGGPGTYRGNGTQDGYDNVSSCSDYLYTKLAIFSSSGDSACSGGRVDQAFQECVVNATNALNPYSQNYGRAQDDELQVAAKACLSGTERTLVPCTDALTPYFGGQYRLNAAGYCASARSANFAQCVGTMYARGGLRPEQSIEYCNQGLSTEVINCVADNYQQTRITGTGTIMSCKDKFDPVAIARRAEAARKAAEEARRKAQAEADARAAAQRAAEQARAAAEARARAAAAEQARVAAEQARVAAEQARAAAQAKADAQAKAEADARAVAAQKAAAQAKADAVAKAAAAQKAAAQAKADADAKAAAAQKAADEAKRKADDAKRAADEAKKNQKPTTTTPSNPAPATPAPAKTDSGDSTNTTSTPDSSGSGGGPIVDLPNF